MPAAAMAHAADPRSVDQALARGVVYRALALALRGPEHLASGAAPACRSALLPAADLLDAARRGTAPLSPAATRFGEWLVAGSRDPVAFARLFGHARGSVCPFETEYGEPGAHRQPHELADIAGYYLAFGVAPAARADERADHVACECEFLELLARKEAFLLAGGAPEMSEADRAETLAAVREATRGFLREHLGRFGRAFATRLVREGGDGYAAVGELLLRFLDLECRRFAVPAGPAELALRPPEPDETPMACGSGACGTDPDLIQLDGRRP